MKDKEKQNISMKEMLTKRSVEPITNCNCRQNKAGAFVDLLNQEIEELQKSKAIEEMAKEIFNTCAWRFGKPNDYKEIFNDIAEDLTKLNYRKITDSVVLSKEELTKRDYEFRQIGYDECLRDNPKKDKYIKTLERKIDQLNAKLDQASKETAEKIFHTLLNCHGHFSEEHANEYSYSIDKDRKYMFVSKAFILKLAKQSGVEIKE